MSPDPHVQGDMTEAMKTLDAGMAAAELEARASSKALPVTAPACGPDGTPAVASAEAAAPRLPNAAIPSSSLPVQEDQQLPGPSSRQQATPVDGPSNGSGDIVAAQTQQGTELDQNADMAHSPERSRVHASLGAGQNSRAGQSPGAVQSSNIGTADTLDNSGHAMIKSEMPAAAHASLDYFQHSPGNNSISKSHVDSLHADARSSSSSQAGTAHSQVRPSDVQTPDSAIQVQTDQAPAASKSSQYPSSQPAAASLQPSLASGSLQPGVASGSADRRELEAHRTASAAALPACADSALAQHSAGLAAAAVSPTADVGAAAMQQPVKTCSGSAAAKSLPAWFAEEGHFALMLQDFVVRLSPCKEQHSDSVADALIPWRTSSLRPWHRLNMHVQVALAFEAACWSATTQVGNHHGLDRHSHVEMLSLCRLWRSSRSRTCM